MKKSNKILASVLAGTCVLGGGFALTGCLDKEPTIEVTCEFKNEYYLGEHLDVTGGILTYTNENGKSIYVAIESDMITGFTADSEGERNMIITYENLTILYPYTVSDYPFAQIGVPYYIAVEPENSGLDELSYSVVIFNEDETLSLWQTSILPTVNNAEELFKTGSSGAGTVNEKYSYSKSVVDGKYVVTIADADSTSIVIEIRDENTIKFTQTYQVMSQSAVMKVAGNEDDGLEYDEYYVANFEGSTEQPWGVLVLTADGKAKIYGFAQQPTAQNINNLVAQAEIKEEVNEGTYTSSIDDGVLTFQVEGATFWLNQDGTISGAIGMSGLLQFNKIV